MSANIWGVFLNNGDSERRNTFNVTKVPTTVTSGLYADRQRYVLVLIHFILLNSMNNVNFQVPLGTWLICQHFWFTARHAFAIIDAGLHQTTVLPGNVARSLPCSTNLRRSSLPNKRTKETNKTNSQREEFFRAQTTNGIPGRLRPAICPPSRHVRSQTARDACAAPPSRPVEKRRSAGILGGRANNHLPPLDLVQQNQTPPHLFFPQQQTLRYETTTSPSFPTRGKTETRFGKKKLGNAKTLGGRD